MNVTIISFLGYSNTFVVWYTSLFGILVWYNDLTSIVTKIELTGTEKLFTLLMKSFVSFIHEGNGDGDKRISKFLMCDTQLDLLLVFQDYLVCGFSVKCKILVSLG